MNPLGLLTVVAAVLVLLGQWLSGRVRAGLADQPLPRPLRARLTWWATHRAGVTATCVVVAVGGLVGGVLAG